MSDNPPSPYLSEGHWRTGSIITTFDPMPAPSAGIFDAPTVYICCNTEWWSKILERVRVLTRLDAWAGDDDEKYRATQEIERFLSAVNCEDCSDFITDVRVGSNGKIQKKVGGAWLDADGDGGDTTVVNNNNTLAEQMYPPDDVDTGLDAEERACNIASGLSDWMYGMFNDTLDELDAAFDVIQATDAVLRLFPPMYLLSETLGNAMFTIAEATTSVLRALFDTTEKENLLCAIYCQIKETGVVNSTNIAALKVAVETAFDDATLQNAFNGIFVDSLQDASLIHRATLYQSVGGAVDCSLLCIDCFTGGCSLFEDSSTAWEIIQGTHNSSLCDGKEGVVASGGAAEVIFTLPVVASFVVINLKDNNSTGSPMNMLVEIYEDSTLIQTVFDQTFSDVHNCNFSQWTPNTAGNKVRIRFSSGAGISISNINVCWDSA